MLVDRYFEYYEERTLDSLEKLIESFHSYGFESYQEDMNQVFGRYNQARIIEEKCDISTNGSTGRPKTFEFGPNCSNCIRMIEDKLRMRHKKTTLVWNPIFGSGAKIRFKIIESPSNKMDFEIMGRWQLDSHIVRLTKFIEECHAEWGSVNLLSLPHIWMCLTTNPLFREWCEKNSEKINAFVNSDCDPSFKPIKGVRFLDQMIDWGTGLNFYTCEKGFRHFLPIFFKQKDESFNLLNMTVRKFKIDDHVLLGGFNNCSCGKGMVEFKFNSHRNNAIVDPVGSPVDFEGFFNMLNGQYFNLQLHQNQIGEVSVLYSGRDLAEDLGVMEAFLRGKGIDKIKFVSNRYFKVGRKRPPFWRSQELAMDVFSEKNEPKLS